MSRFFVLLLLLIFSKIALCNSFELQSVISKKKFRFYFPTAKVSQVNRINCVRIEKAKRPQFWPDKIPFGVGIDASRSRVHYIYYNSFFNKKILTYEHPDFKQLTDICANSNKLIFAADQQANKIFFVQLSDDFLVPTMSFSLDVEKPMRCEVDGAGRLFIVSSPNTVFIYIPLNNTYTPQKTISNRINSKVANQPIKDLSISRFGNITLLLESKILQFSKYGYFSWEKSVTENRYVSIENSVYGDIFLLNQADHQIEKYSEDFEFLDQISLDNVIHRPAYDMTIYDSFGYVAVNTLDKGAYFGLGTEIKNVRIEKTSDPSSNDHYSIRFLLTFISKITLKIADSQGNIVRALLEKKRLPSGSQRIYWNGKDNNGNPLNPGHYKLTVEATGLYSVANTIKQEIKVKIK